MAYAFNDDKSKYELAGMQQDISDLQDIVSTITGDVHVLENMQQEIDGIEEDLGVDANIAKNKFWASPADSSGHASFRSIVTDDLPSDIPTSKLHNFGVVEDGRWGYDEDWPIHCESGGATHQWTTVGEFTLGPGTYIVAAGVRFGKKAGGFRRMVLAADTYDDPTNLESVCFSDMESCVENRYSILNAVKMIHLNSEHTYMILAQQTSEDNLRVWANARIMHLGSNSLVDFVDRWSSFEPVNEVSGEFTVG